MNTFANKANAEKDDKIVRILLLENMMTNMSSFPMYHVATPNITVNTTSEIDYILVDYLRGSRWCQT